VVLRLVLVHPRFGAPGHPRQPRALPGRGSRAARDRRRGRRARAWSARRGRLRRRARLAAGSLCRSSIHLRARGGAPAGAAACGRAIRRGARERPGPRHRAHGRARPRLRGPRALEAPPRCLYVAAPLP
jgi:hypothetical protein